MTLHIFPVRIIQSTFPKLAHITLSVSPGCKTMLFRGMHLKRQ